MASSTTRISIQHCKPSPAGRRSSKRASRASPAVRPPDPRPSRPRKTACIYAIATATQHSESFPVPASLPRLDDLPLQGKRVLVTAPRQYAARLTPLLLQAGAQPMWIPVIDVAALEDNTDLDQTLTRLSDYTHVAFTSRNGISAVLARAALIYGGLEGARRAVQQSGVRLCALGVDSTALTDAGFDCHVSPKESSTQGLVRELEARGEAVGARVLCPVPAVGGGLQEPPVVPRFLAALTAAAATPTRVDAYATTFCGAPARTQLEAGMLLAGGIDAVAFSSTAEAQGLVQAVGEVGALDRAWDEHGAPLLAAHGPYTAAGVQAVLQRPVPCVSSNFRTFDGLVDALGQAFSSI